MDVKTLWGMVHSRELVTSLQRMHHVVLKDNPGLKPLFDWLKNLHVETIAQVKDRSELLAEKLEEIRFNREVKWYVNHDDWTMVFHNMAPYEGDFPRGIPEYLNLFYLAMYSPRGTFY